MSKKTNFHATTRITKETPSHGQNIYFDISIGITKSESISKTWLRLSRHFPLSFLYLYKNLWVQGSLAFNSTSISWILDTMDNRPTNQSASHAQCHTHIPHILNKWMVLLLFFWFCVSDIWLIAIVCCRTFQFTSTNLQCYHVYLILNCTFI